MASLILVVTSVFECLPIICAICVGVLSRTHESLQHYMASLDKEHIESD